MRSNLKATSFTDHVSANDWRLFEQFFHCRTKFSQVFSLEMGVEGVLRFPFFEKHNWKAVADRQRETILGTSIFFERFSGDDFHCCHCFIAAAVFEVEFYVEHNHGGAAGGLGTESQKYIIR